MTELPAPSKRRELQEQIREMNMQLAAGAVEAGLMLLPRVVEMAMESDDPDLVRKVFDTVAKAGLSMEPKVQQPTNNLPNLSFNIVLDPNVPQVAPANKRKKVEYEDAVIVERSVTVHGDDVNLSEYL